MRRHPAYGLTRLIDPVPWDLHVSGIAGSRSVNLCSYNPNFAAALSLNSDPRRISRRNTGILLCPVWFMI